MLTGLHARNVGLMDAEPLGQLSLGEVVLGPVVGDLDGEPAGKRRPLPLRSELGIAQLLCENVVTGYELISHARTPKSPITSL